MIKTTSDLKCSMQHHRRFQISYCNETGLAAFNGIETALKSREIVEYIGMLLQIGLIEEIPSAYAPAIQEFKYLAED